MNSTPAQYTDILEVDVKDLSPTMRGLVATINRLPKAICLARIGDFYETFSEGAKILSKELEVVLTSKKIGVKRF